LKTLGKAYDAFRGLASPGDPHAWCTLHSLFKSARYDLEIYGESTAATLAEAWCHRMQYLYSLHKEAGVLRYAYSSADYDNYQEPAAFLNLLPTLQGKVLHRALQIRDIRPM